MGLPSYSEIILDTLHQRGESTEATLKRSIKSRRKLGSRKVSEYAFNNALKKLMDGKDQLVIESEDTGRFRLTAKGKKHMKGASSKKYKKKTTKKKKKGCDETKCQECHWAKYKNRVEPSYPAKACHKEGMEILMENGDIYETVGYYKDKTYKKLLHAEWEKRK